MNEYNIQVIDQLQDHQDLNQLMNECTKVEVIDFLPPHFIPDIANPNDIIAYEKEIEESDGAFEYSGGLIIVIATRKTYEYLRMVYQKLYGLDKHRYAGTEREIFKINYYDVLGKRKDKKYTLVQLDDKNGRLIARFNSVAI